MTLVPETVAEMRPPRPSDIITEVAACMRAHWEDEEELRRYYKAISGEGPSPHGSIRLDEAALTFKFIEIVRANGYDSLCNVTSEVLRKALRYAYKRNTGVPIHQLEQQRKRLRHQQPEPE